jgi:hypothetical protein
MTVLDALTDPTVLTRLACVGVCCWWVVVQLRKVGEE